jgi:hypothetical protein
VQQQRKWLMMADFTPKLHPVCSGMGNMSQFILAAGMLLLL